MSEGVTYAMKAYVEITESSVGASQDTQRLIEALATATKHIIESVDRVHSSVVDGCPPQ